MISQEIKITNRKKKGNTNKFPTFICGHCFSFGQLKIGWLCKFTTFSFEVWCLLLLPPLFVGIVHLEMGINVGANSNRFVHFLLEITKWTLRFVCFCLFVVFPHKINNAIRTWLSCKTNHFQHWPVQEAWWRSKRPMTDKLNSRYVEEPQHNNPSLSDATLSIIKTNPKRKQNTSTKRVEKKKNDENKKREPEPAPERKETDKIRWTIMMTLSRSCIVWVATLKAFFTSHVIRNVVNGHSPTKMCVRLDWVSAIVLVHVSMWIRINVSECVCVCPKESYLRFFFSCGLILRFYFDHFLYGFEIKLTSAVKSVTAITQTRWQIITTTMGTLKWPWIQQ